ncbi:hypothetical protein GW813_14795 [bacterium]|nr:hypothetical protein [bacterium]
MTITAAALQNLQTHWALSVIPEADRIRAADFGDLDKHFESGIKAATASGDARHEMILRWLHAAGRIMVTNSLWWGTRRAGTGRLR